MRRYSEIGEWRSRRRIPTGLLLAVALWGGAPAMAQAASSATDVARMAAGPDVGDQAESAPVRAVSHVAITVGDLSRAVEFYTGVLTFEVVAREEKRGPDVDTRYGLNGAKTRTARLRLGAEHIELVEFSAPAGRAFPADTRSNDRWFQHIAIITSDMDQAYRRLREHRVRHASSGPQRLPDWNAAAGGIRAFYFRDPDGHFLEVLQFPPRKGDPRWQSREALFLGIDHTAIVIADTERSLRFYRDELGLKVVGEGENYGYEQEQLNHVFGARLRITTLRAAEGPGVELLEYLSPTDGREYPIDARPSDLLHWHTAMNIESSNGSPPTRLVRDPDGHAVLLAPGESSMRAASARRCAIDDIQTNTNFWSNRMSAENQRLEQTRNRSANWQRWGPYLSERQWGTVREDYSADGDCWNYFPHDHARSRAYRWGEDGLLGFTDRQCRLCFGLALWNERDPILKERLFGLTGPEGNHGEDVKECYYYLDATPTYSYTRALYKYPQAEFPYARLVEENRRRGRDTREYELTDTGVFDDQRYFDVFAEYAKAASDDVLIRLTITNRGPDAARLHVLPTLWFRNTWSWGCTHEGCEVKLRIERAAADRLVAQHATLAPMELLCGPGPEGAPPTLLFTENETNVARLYHQAADGRVFKDAFHDYVVAGRTEAVSRESRGTKAAAHYVLSVPARGEVVLRLRLRSAAAGGEAAGGRELATAALNPHAFDAVFAERKQEADEFYAERLPATLSAAERSVARQAYAGLLFTKQFYHYVVRDWLQGDPAQPAPPLERLAGRNREWGHVFNRDLISMPDKWEYPWYAAWDLAFHMLPMAHVDPQFAKDQLVLFLREWYMHPNGQIPAYEFALGDVNPPVHAWAVWRVYKMTGPRGGRDRAFLERCFHKLMLNFTWWVNRKDPQGNNLFSGGFLGMDNIGVFDRSRPLPPGVTLEQADGTAWMGFFCATMLSMALELARENPAYEDVASKFFEHFVAIVDAMNHFGGTGLWHEEDGFYYDHLRRNGRSEPLRIRSMVGLVPLFAVEVLESELIDRLPGFKKRAEWFLKNRPDLARQISYLEREKHGVNHAHYLLAIPSRERLERLLRYVLDESELLAPHGVRSLSRAHRDQPFILHTPTEALRVDYVPGDSNTGMFGGNSNWRGPIWFPMNYLLVEALERYHHFYGDEFTVEFPTGSGQRLTLQQVAQQLYRRIVDLFVPGASGARPCHGDEQRYADDPHWRELVLFHEYFDGDTGRGVGASHQTGWTALITRCLEALGSDAEPPAPASTPTRTPLAAHAPDGLAAPGALVPPGAAAGVVVREAASAVAVVGVRQKPLSAPG